MSSELHTHNASESEAFTNEVEPNSLGHNIATLAIVIIPFIGLLIAVWLAWQSWVFTTDIVLAVTLYVFTGFGVTIGFHRLLTHRSFSTHSWLRGLFTVAGSMAIEGKPTSWVADHRRHHTHADQPGDPHSPHVGFENQGILGILKGLWHAHIGWLISEGAAKEERFVPDLLKDKTVMSVSSRFFSLYLPLSLVLPAVAGFFLTGLSWKGAVTGFIWGGLVRIFVTHHITWSVNSICHMIGRRPFETDDKSTNNWLLALPTFGEAWHHNHHAFPTSAFHGLRSWQRALDPSGWVIWWMEKLGLAWDVKRVSEEQMAKKLA